ALVGADAAGVGRRGVIRVVGPAGRAYVSGSRGHAIAPSRPAPVTSDLTRPRNVTAQAATAATTKKRETPPRKPSSTARARWWLHSVYMPSGKTIPQYAAS